MMALQPPVTSDKKRVKVYELRDNDWFDRGTGFCTGSIQNEEPRIFVESEEQPDKVLLETRIIKDDIYQKQQDTLIVWTEPNGVDMALSFQEAEGCAAIWDFVHQVQQQLLAMADDGLSDDALDNMTTVFTLNPPTLDNLEEIEQNIRSASISQAGREALAKFLVKEEYLLKLIKLVEIAEDLEDLGDLHRLCNIMKALILMNDNAVIEHLVTDDIILGVVGALEYDPDFPTHKANHRQYLSDASRYKEVVEIKDDNIKKKIRHTWRLQYLKDVVLARILDDPTFGVLNSLIFFNQVDIVQHLQSNNAFLRELFGIFTIESEPLRRKEQAVQFIQQCAAIAKTLQVGNRATLLNNFISHGLFNVITFAVKHPSPSLRTTGIDILVALLDHDPNMMRGYMLKAVHERKTPLIDTLIELLHQETDLGVKNQLADAIKILLDPSPPQMEPTGQRPGAEYMAKVSRPAQLTPTQAANEQFAQEYFDRSCRKLFTPLKALEHRQDLHMPYQETTLCTYLVEILTFFVRQHPQRSKPFINSEDLSARVAQLLRVSQKSLKLTALKFFRTCITLQDVFYMAQVTKSDAFDGILNIVMENVARDNLLNSACLELFEAIKKEAIKTLILHLGNNFKLKLQEIAYVKTFNMILLDFDKLTTVHHDSDLILFSQADEDSPIDRHRMTGQWSASLPDMDPEQEDYFNTSDDDLDISDDDLMRPNGEKLGWQKRKLRSHAPNNNPSPPSKPLVDYEEDGEDEDDLASSSPTGSAAKSEKVRKDEQKHDTVGTKQVEKRLQPSPELKEVESPPDRVAEKRRRQGDEEEDELNKLSVKRRNSSSASLSGLASSSSLRRKKGFLQVQQPSDHANSDDDDQGTDGKVKRVKPRKIAISLQNSQKTEEAGTGEKENKVVHDTKESAKGKGKG